MTRYEARVPHARGGEPFLRGMGLLGMDAGEDVKGGGETR